MQLLPDTQNEFDHRMIPIERVGIRELRYPGVYRCGAGEEQGVIATYEMTVALPAHLKGTHMSRFVAALHSVQAPICQESILALVEDLAQRLDASSARVSCDFSIFRKKTAPASGMESLMDYEVNIEASIEEGKKHQTYLRVRVPVATLCPCSKAISDRGAHNQRGAVSISVEVTGDLCPEALIVLAEDSASCELYAGLKRTDEKAVTERAYDQPVFVEDLARNVAAGLAETEGLGWYRVEAENFESIHHHNAYAMIEGGSQS